MTTTLSQIGLAMHFKRSAAWIRKQGEYISLNGETWARAEYSNGRLSYYEKVR